MSRDRGGRRALRRQAAHADRGGRAGGGEPRGARRADHRDAVAQRLDPLAAGPRPRRDAVRAGRPATRALAILETRTVNGIVVLDTQGRAYTIRGAEIPGGRGDGVPVTTLIDLQPGAHVAHAHLRRARAEVPGGGHRRLRLRRDLRRHGRAAARGQGVHDARPRRGAARRRCRSRPGSTTSRRCPRAAGCSSSRSPRCARCRAGAASSSWASTAARSSRRSASRRPRASCCRAPTGSVARSPSAIEGEELAKHLLHRARKGSLAAPKLKVTGFAREG